MGLRLSVYGWVHLTAAAIVLVLCACISIWHAIDHAVNYTQVVAAVDSVERRCRPTASSAELRREVTKDADWPEGNWGDCDSARWWARQHGRGFGIEHAEIAYVRFVSPADGREHGAGLDLRRARGRAIAAGTRIPLYAHDRDPSLFDPV